ncbi:50S ribosomal protein L25 [Pontiella sulfatireligans]|uniref:Large ribosomal subunit protein bL25 n=1 Tax=Pontiella sulfatireligans TaxID=2750658 RepID=A0A6C2UKD3_9BACT|nr:50S ribosomal protein L25 [Pontiella sulfatireligans]VGO20343.1 50S ribosomal protein L25 [Pontiella sulfatireligans]
MEDAKLIAKKRTSEGSSNARRMRSAGSLPAVIYGDEKEPVSIELNAHDFGQILHHHASESLIIEIALEGEGDMNVLIKEVQRHPVTSDLLHIDLLRVAANKVIAVDIPVELVGEAAGVKAGGSIDHVMHSIGVECLPGEMVEAFEVDVSALEIGDSLSVADLNLDSKFKLLVDEDAIIASVSEPTAEEEEAEEATDEPEVITEKNVEE